MPQIPDEAHRLHRERERVNNPEFDHSSLHERDWKSYSISQIFDIRSGKRLESRNRKRGRRPFIGALDNSNGIAGFTADKNSSLDNNVLGVNYNGNGDRVENVGVRVTP